MVKQKFFKGETIHPKNERVYNTFCRLLRQEVGSSIKPSDIITEFETGFENIDDIQFRYGIGKNSKLSMISQEYRFSLPFLEMTIYEDGIKSIHDVNKSIARLFYFPEEHALLIDQIYLHKSAYIPQKKGAASRIIDNATNAIKLINPSPVKYILEAAQQGRFVWGRCAFLPNDETWNEQIYTPSIKYFETLESEKQGSLIDIQKIKMDIYKHHIFTESPSKEAKLMFYYVKGVMDPTITLAEEVMNLKNTRGHLIVERHTLTIDSDVQRELLNAVIERNLNKPQRINTGTSPEQGIG